jgi:hypothetical protein
VRLWEHELPYERRVVARVSRALEQRMAKSE